MKKALGLACLLISFSAYSQQQDTSFAQKAKMMGLNVTVGKSNCSSTINSNCKPVLVVDQTIVPLSQLSTIDPNNIVSVNIIKREKAILLYGTAGADGAIIVTTKCKSPQARAL